MKSVNLSGPPIPHLQNGAEQYSLGGSVLKSQMVQFLKSGVSLKRQTLKHEMNLLAAYLMQEIPGFFPLCFLFLYNVYTLQPDDLGYSIHAVLELAVLLLSQPCKSWDHRHEPLYSSVLCLIYCFRVKQVFYHWAAALAPLHLYFEINFAELPWPASTCFVP